MFLGSALPHFLYLFLLAGSRYLKLLIPTHISKIVEEYPRIFDFAEKVYLFFQTNAGLFHLYFLQTKGRGSRFNLILAEHLIN
jgi:hypothetical protein